MNDNRKWNQLDSPRGGRMAYRILLVLAAAAVAAGLFFKPHGHYQWETWFAFYGVYGFLCYFFLVVVARGLRKLVMRKEDYYDPGDA